MAGLDMSKLVDLTEAIATETPVKFAESFPKRTYLVS